MKLPDFLAFEPMNELRQNMGDAQLGEMLTVKLGNRLTLDELNQLSKQGLDIRPSEIEFLPDGTLAYKGGRVLLYIRDIEEFSHVQKDLPRFHIAHCRTLDQMLHNNRFERYVVATRIDGLFNLKQKKAWENKFRPIERELDVCQNCLDHLRWNDFSIRGSIGARRTAVSGFSIASFFQRYGVSLFKETPRYSDQDAPVNEYPADFSNISNRVRSERNWTCENCGVNFSSSGDRQYLHTHHKNGVKSDNSPSNLIVLCLACHAQQPQHAHLRQSEAFRQFLAAHPTPNYFRGQAMKTA
jgi:hypothetical protein